jgi:PAT family beta-lactamase induction signal transducer AmpG
VSGEPAPKGWLDSARVYLEPPVLVVLLLGFASGLPLALTGATLTFRLAESGVSKGEIGLFALVGIAYGWKFLWSPVIDQVPLPLLGRWLGRRRGWLVAIQLALALAIVALGLSDPAHHLGLTAMLAVLVAFLSASQDIVIDAYRIEILERRQQGAGAATIVAGYRVAMLVSGAGTLILASLVGWSAAYTAMAACLLVGMLTALLYHEPAGSTVRVEATGTARQRIAEAVVEPLADFFRRAGVRRAALILLFIALYKLGDALLGAMSNPFYVDLGFTKTEVATVVKLFGLLASVAGGFLGGIIINARGILKGLWICGLCQMLSNLVFVLQAWVGHDVGVLALTISLENLAGGMGTAAFVAYLSSLCNVAYTATQYALLSSFMAQARTLLAAGSGFLAAALGWVGFFVLTTVAAIPGLLLLLVLQRQLAPRDPVPAAVSSPAG